MVEGREEGGHGERGTARRNLENKYKTPRVLELGSNHFVFPNVFWKISLMP